MPDLSFNLAVVIGSDYLRMHASALCANSVAPLAK